ncbi:MULTISPECIES: NAD(P)H-dependent oxidoreductase [unclassified Paenibacillus]|uniref:NAD(P)H-dependent oxidoreductase n=1 Tax=unclassified Paenibacillus TaxID=185978 RepID=UPI0024B88D54|nr:MULTISPECIES: NAD(P)H-dependent oxidoreductase [unclassified Paenibacillus]
MSTILFLTAHSGFSSHSCVLSVGQQLADSYRATYPQHKIIHFDLYDLQVPEINSETIKEGLQTVFQKTTQEQSDLIPCLM